MSTRNADMPAMPIEINGFGQYAPEAHTGLTKREQACIALGVPETGDEELDSIIKKSERKRIAMNAMQGMLSNQYVSDFNDSDASWNNKLTSRAVSYADALLKELEK